jgi:hypothetical protein
MIIKTAEIIVDEKPGKEAPRLRETDSVRVKVLFKMKALRNLIRLMLLLMLLLPCHAEASITEFGAVMSFRDDHAFYFTAPTGRDLDNQTVENSGDIHGN